VGRVQGRAFTLIVIEGGATLKALTRLMPRRLAYWTVLRMLRSGSWDALA
jgi:hypothetical protein